MTLICRLLLGTLATMSLWSTLMLSASIGSASSLGRDPRLGTNAETTRGVQPEASTYGLTYAVSINALGDSVLDRAVEESSMLERLREEGSLGAFGLIARAETDVDRIDRVLRSFGYYDAVIAVRIAGLDLDDPALLPRLERHLPGTELQVQVQIDAGPLYRLGTVRLDGPVTPAARAAFSLRSGEPATAPEVLAAGATVLEALREDGFPFALVPAPEAIVDHRTRTMTVVYRAEPGERLPIGEIEIIGLERLRERYVRRRLGLQPGEPYSPSRLEAARRALVASEALASARLITASAADASGRVPLRLEVVERPLRVLRVVGAYSSDEGGSLSAAWTHRNLFGGAERLTLGAELSQISAGPLGDINDSASAALRIPDLWRRDLDLQLKLGAVSERLDAYDRDALTASAQLEQRLSPRARVSAGLGFEHATISQDGPSEDIDLLSLPMTLDWDASDDPLDPRRGWRLAAQVTPAPLVEAERGAGDPFVRAQFRASAYLDLSGRGMHPLEAVADADEPVATGPSPAPLIGRRVLAARLVIGRILGASASAVPPDWRFYAGGGGSVRGYPFQSIGPRTANGSPAGGDALLEGSLELRQRIGARWGIAGFVDVGDASADGFRGFGNLAIGVGLGARFHTPVGPVRADLATPLTIADDDPPVQLYIGIGQAF